MSNDSNGRKKHNFSLKQDSNFNYKIYSPTITNISPTIAYFQYQFKLNEWTKREANEIIKKYTSIISEECKFPKIKDKRMFHIHTADNGKKFGVAIYYK